MNWDAVGAIAELIGATAVVLTLVYLSIQLRQNTRAVEHATERGVWEDARFITGVVLPVDGGYTAR